MINRIKSFLALGALVAIGSATATEYRTPWVSERGPLRYSFEKLHEDKYNLNFWKTFHAKLAKKAFGRKNDCGSATKKVPLTTLIFNKSDFRLNEIFPDSKVPINSEFYNPFMSFFKLSPRAHYYEWGATFGGRFDIPVYKDAGKVVGRFGVRATVPVRCIEMERKNITNVNADPLSDVHCASVEQVTQQLDGATPGGGNKEDVVVQAFRLDWVKALRDGNKTSSSLVFKDNQWSMFGKVVAYDPTAPANIRLGLVSATEGARPAQCGFQFHDGTPTVKFPDGFSATAAEFAPIAADGSFAADKIGFPANNVDYSGLETMPAAVKDKLASQWLVFKYGINSSESDLVDDAVGATTAKEILRLLEARSKCGTEGIEDFFLKNCFEFETSRRKGLGDIDIDIFYEHQFNEEWIAEVMLGVRLPTGAGSNKCNNPYNVNLGNGGHFEIKLGGLVAYQPLSWMNIKVDGYWSWVLSDTEKRAATFKGSKIKGIGPCVDADVDWNYGVFNFDLNFIHPKTTACRSMIGYQLYYKDDDKVRFKKCKSVQSWLGRKYQNNAAMTAVELVANPQELDSCLAAANTNSIAHKLRSECSVMVNKYCEIFAGGAWTFAGKNVFCDVDGHIGFNCLF